MSKMNNALIKELEESLSKTTSKEFVREIESLKARTGYGSGITFNEYFGVK